MWRSVGERFRVLRRRLRLRQEDLARLAGISRQVVQRIESGQWDGIGLDKVHRVAGALGARLHVGLTWNGEQLDRLVDAGHAELQNTVAAMLRGAGWLVAVEVSFNHYGDRGRYDIVAYHPATRIVLVVEIKTAIGDVQATLGILDVKVRLALTVARQQGWEQPLVAVPALVIADERQQHRVVSEHDALFSRFSMRARPARAWIRRPATDVSGLLMYVPMTNARLVGVRKASRGERVRGAAATMTSGAPGGHMSPLEPPSLT